MRASDLFKELGFNSIGSVSSIVYAYETDYDRFYVNFELEMKRYCITHSRFVDRNDVNWVSMNRRPQNVKHSARYGTWVSENCIFVDEKIHNAIHKQLLELGWIENENNR